MRDSYVWVATESQLKELADVLRKQKVFAVDTEQHSLRSFLGFTALIQVMYVRGVFFLPFVHFYCINDVFILVYVLRFEQISTQNEDYLVDTIALHDAMDVLRPVFANPSICKVICLLHIKVTAFV